MPKKVLSKHPKSKNLARNYYSKPRNSQQVGVISDASMTTRRTKNFGSPRLSEDVSGDISRKGVLSPPRMLSESNS